MNISSTNKTHPTMRQLGLQSSLCLLVPINRTHILLRSRALSLTLSQVLSTSLIHQLIPHLTLLPIHVIHVLRTRLNHQLPPPQPASHPPEPRATYPAQQPPPASTRPSPYYSPSPPATYPPHQPPAYQPQPPPNYPPPLPAAHPHLPATGRPSLTAPPFLAPPFPRRAPPTHFADPPPTCPRPSQQARSHPKPGQIPIVSHPPYPRHTVARPDRPCAHRGEFIGVPGGYEIFSMTLNLRFAAIMRRTPQRAAMVALLAVINLGYQHGSIATIWSTTHRP
eukprot:GHVN01082181.1.p1 GENE.GHVN01082181.1~~GHVN01082181.1.p1  ORF type:complete len:280 (-),score=30.16 GHVN01082181.1:116-955(-)